MVGSVFGLAMREPYSKSHNPIKYVLTTTSYKYNPHISLGHISLGPLSLGLLSPGPVAQCVTPSYTVCNTRSVLVSSTVYTRDPIPRDLRCAAKACSVVRIPKRGDAQRKKRVRLPKDPACTLIPWEAESGIGSP